MLYCLYYEKESLWHEYFSNKFRHDVNSILCYVSKFNSTHLLRGFFVKLVSLIRIRSMCRRVVQSW